MNHLLQNWSALKDCLAQSSPCFSVGGVGVGGEGRGGGHRDQFLQSELLHVYLLFISCFCIKLLLCKPSIAERVPLDTATLSESR